jgi:hypothetical protein
MPVEFNSVTGIDLTPYSFINRWEFGPHPLERPNAKRAASIAVQKHAKVHVLSVNQQDYGFVAVDIHQFGKEKKGASEEKHFYLQILYLFVSAPYRRVPVDELDGMTPSEYLLSQVITKSLDTAAFFPFKGLVLLPASDKLVPLYESLEFSALPHLPDGWMMLPLNLEK